MSEKERERERTEEEVEEGEDDNKETKEQIKSTPALLTLTYRTTEPRMNTFFTVASCWSFCGFFGWGVSKDGALAEEGRRERRGKKKLACGCRSGSPTLISVSLMFKYWSTLWSTPVMARSFLSSTVTSLPTRVLKKE